ncbi:MAG: acyl-CoA/acyl-ACP dehydrogenase [Deltaproteobacteria bacterium]|nr:acyl-CoA/acyl-ACP dehydrogenase [Deltaproteobacteria bacterium]
MLEISSTQNVCSLARALESRANATATVAAANAPVVDREARFPAEAFAVAKTQRLLGILVPTELGGEGATLSDVVNICYMLSAACGATGMIFAMHQIMVAILIRHAQNNAWHRALLRRLADEQLLIASSTTEGQGGGDLRSSVCAVEQTGSHISLVKSATVMSYGIQADAILTTARRSPDALASDQVLVSLLKDDYRLEPIMDWDTLGMRGTCSSGFMLKGSGKIDQVLLDSYQKIQAETMMPVAHLTWSAVWAGIAACAVERARRFVRNSGRNGNGQVPAGAVHLARASMSLRALIGIIASALERYEAASAEEDELQALDFQNAMNLLKVTTSEMAISTVMTTMQICGLAGYRNDGEFSISRCLRDILSSSLMINNDRILANSAMAAILIEAPQTMRN